MSGGRDRERLGQSASEQRRLRVRLHSSSGAGAWLRAGGCAVVEVERSTP